MAAPPSLGVTINPNTPSGDEPLKLGPPRFHEIKQTLLSLFNLSSATTQTLLAPFWYDTDDGPQTNGLLSVLGDPDSPLGIATKGYADGKVQELDFEGGPNDFTVGNVDATFLWNSQAIYHVKVTVATTNTGPVQVQAGTQATIPVRWFTDENLSAGDLLPQADYLGVFRDSRLLLIGFVGGTLTHPLILSEDPLVPMEAATKQYVDAGAAAQPQSVVLPSPVVIQNTVTDLGWQVVINTPNDGNNHIVHISWSVFLFQSDRSEVAIWAVDDAGPTKFCLGGAIVGINYAPGTPAEHTVASASSFSPVYGPNQTVTIKIQGQTILDTARADVSVGAWTDAPPSTLVATLMRAQP